MASNKANIKDNRINERIRVKEVRVIDQNGNQKGIMNTRDALNLARDLGLDLVEVAPFAKPPVCKFLDYGKFKFEKEKKSREAKKKQRQIKLKEIRMQPKIEKHDMDFKTKHIKEFLEQGCKVKVTVRFRGRELAHTELGRAVLDKILNNLEDSYVIESRPAMEGRFMSMLLSPNTKKKKG